MSRLERASHIAEIVSAVAVVISIIYLAQQIRANTAAVNFETSRGLLELQFQQDTWDQDLALVELKIRGSSDPDSLSSAQWAQLSRRFALQYNVWALAFTGYQKGTLDLDDWEGWNRSYGGTACMKGYQRFWEERKHWWGEDFQQLVEQHADNCQMISD